MLAHFFIFFYYQIDPKQLLHVIVIVIFIATTANAISAQFGQTTSVDVGMGNKASHSQSESEDSDTSRLPPSGRGRGRGEAGHGESIEEAEDPEVELPPPMRPISSIPAPEEGSSNKRVINF